MDINKILKVVFIFAALALLYTLMNVTKTHCDDCEIPYEGKLLDGYEAWAIFENDCISYAKPWDSWKDDDLDFNISFNTSPGKPLYADIDCINSTYDERGIQNIDIKPECITG